MRRYLLYYISSNAFRDSIWARSPNDRKSTSGYGVFLNKHLVSWSVEKQNVVARSSTEVEYKQSGYVAREGLTPYLTTHSK